MLVACNDSTNPLHSRYVQTQLVADVSGFGTATLDPYLVNPWGLAFGPTGLLWVANNHTGTSTQYDADGAIQPLVVAIPTNGSATGGAPTGLIYNPTTSFVIPGAGAALFIFAGEDGVISAWNATSVTARVVANRAGSDAVYKGIAIARNGSADVLYATNFKHNGVDMFNSNFQFISSFTDPNVPSGYAPFGIQNIGGKLYVTFAKQLAPGNVDDEPGVGNGYVDIFNADGTLSSRFASRGSLNAPWGIAVAPSGFGASSDILIGNFGDGSISAFNATTGSFDGLLRGTDNNPISIEGLWGLTFGPGTNSTTLYFTAGPGDEAHGVLGTLTLQ